MTRLFVAIWLPEHVHDQLRQVVASDMPVRWMPERNWHVTLRFIGDADPTQVTSALEGATLPSATATVGGRLEWLGDSQQRRRSLVVPVTGVDSLAATVESATRGHGMHERRRFGGHVTLGRGRVDEVELSAAVEETSFAVTTISLVASELHASGSTYTSLADFGTR